MSLPQQRALSRRLTRRRRSTGRHSSCFKRALPVRRKRRTHDECEKREYAPRSARELEQGGKSSGLKLRDHRTTAAGNLLFFLCGDNPDLFCSEAENFEAVRSCGPNAIAVLSNAAGEDKKLNTAEESNVCPDYLAYRNGKAIQRKSGMRVVGASTFFQHLHITLAGRKSEEAALMVEQIFKLIGAELLIAQKVEENARIKIARARTHRDATRGSEAHGGVD